MNSMDGMDEVMVAVLDDIEKRRSLDFAELDGVLLGMS